MGCGAGRRGFTLAETILVLTIGSVILAGATILYNFAKTASGDAAAKSRVGALCGLVERMTAQKDGVIPTVGQLRLAWGARQDALSNPYGGRIQCAEASCSVHNIRDVLICDPTDTQTTDACYNDRTVPGDSGVLVYAHFPDSGPGSLPNIKDSHTALWDNNLKAYVHVRGWAVASENANGRQFYFVQGPPDDSSGVARAPDLVRDKGVPSSCGCGRGLVQSSDYNR